MLSRTNWTLSRKPTQRSLRKPPSGDFNGNVSVVFTPLPTQPAGQSYSCMLYPMTSAGGIQGWMGYTPGPTQQYYQGVGNISGNGNFP
jgi:hypothetical protein